MNKAEKQRGKTIVHTHIWTLFYLFLFTCSVSLYLTQFLSFSYLLYLTQYIRVVTLSWNDKLDLIPEMQFYLRTCIVFDMRRWIRLVYTTFEMGGLLVTSIILRQFDLPSY